MFSAEVRVSGGAAVIDLEGEIAGPADEALGQAYEEASGSSAIVLNFADVSYMNSTGIALVVALLARARKAGIEIRAYGLSEHYREIFEITRLADFVGIFQDEGSAVGDTALKEGT